MAKNYVDLLVVIPLEEELLEFSKVFKGKEDRSTSTEFRYLVDCGWGGITTLLVQQQGMGKTSASRATNSALSEYDVGLAISLGIAGGIAHDLHIGDVCYTGSVIDVYDNAKTNDDVDGDLDLEFSPSYYSTPPDIVTPLNGIRLLPQYSDEYAEWQLLAEDAACKLVSQGYSGRGGHVERIGLPASRVGRIACGTVNKSAVYRQKLLSLDRKILAIDTESGGLFEAATQLGVPAISIRGISDYADRGKNQLEAATGGLLRRVAAANASSFLALQLRNQSFLDFLGRRRTGGRPHQPSELSGGLSGLLQQIGAEVDQKLRELSPEFKLQPKGYQLPTPRVKWSVLGETAPENVRDDPVELRDALQTSQAVVINVPRTWPDHSLPWVIASDLLTAELNGKQPVPIVINGSDVGPPNSGLERLSHITDLRKLAAASGAQLVFVINSIPLKSKTKIDYLADQMKGWETAKFVIICDSDADMIEENTFSIRVAAQIVKLCNVSFAEITDFIQKNFGMRGADAEVIALRLYNTFEKFNLAAHPTYFAGIPGETLAALLQANRRAELIQLAVDGFLTFVVASDHSDITLSRTTRARFLRRLAVELRVEKKRYSQSELVQFAAEFAAEHDFDILPLGFVQSFVDKGILNFANAGVEFSLPFIEAYLLAFELRENPDLAERYFKSVDETFDLSAFDLYCEMGPSEAIVRQVLGLVEDAQETLSKRASNRSMLLNAEMAPEYLKNPGRMGALRERLLKAAADVRESQNTTQEKQRLLDVAERVRETTAEQTEPITTGKAGGTEPGPESLVTTLGPCLQRWIMGVVMLGSGAEHLNAVTKRKMASLLPRVAAAIIEEWTTAYSKADFGAVKAELLKPESLASFVSDGDPEETSKLKGLIDSLVSVLEFGFLSQPFSQIVGWLCEQARHRVLSTSVAAAQVSGDLEAVLHATWLADLDSKQGKDKLKATMKELPPAPFLRVVLTTHLLTRAYWSHGETEDRLALLNAAEEVLKPLSPIFDKGEIRRIILGDDKDKRA